MFFEFFKLELKSVLKAPMIYIFIFIMTFMCFMAVVSDNVVIGGSVGNVYKNAPYIITQYVTILSLLFGVLFAVAFFNNAALRDYNNQFNEILFSTPISKASYFFGRFFGALVLSTIPLLGIFIGIFLGGLIGPAAGWIDADRIGELYLATFVNNYLLFILPNMFIAGAIVFVLANKYKNTIVSFVGAFGLIIAYIITGTLLSDIDNESLAALLDMFGIRSYSVETRYFTPIEKNTLSPAFSGLLLYNRLIWIGFGILMLLLNFKFFSFKEKSKKAKKAKAFSETVIEITKPKINIGFTFSSRWAQFFSLFKISFLNIVKSVVFKVLFLFALIILITDMVGGFEYYGLQSYPLTYKVVDMVDGASAIFMIIIMIFFSGELVWNDRNNHINEVINASPHLSFSSLAAKVLTLLSVVSAMYFLFSIIGIAYQLILGFTAIEFGLYFTTFIYDLLPGYFFFSMFFIFIQVVTNQKYQAYFISIALVFLIDIILLILDVQTNMISLGSTPSLSYSDMNGFGPGFKGAMWFNLYWGLLGVLLLFLSALFWVRTSGGNFKTRLKTVYNNFNGALAAQLAAVFVLWLLTASFVYYNTQILNEYQSSDYQEKMAVRYEQKYKKYENITLPKVTKIKYEVDIFPQERNVNVKADLWVKNKSEELIDSIHYNLDENWEIDISIPNAELVMNDDSLSYRIYALNQPMRPGDSMNIIITSKYETKGFSNGRGSTSIIENGTFLNNGSVLPRMGYESGVELSDKNDRKKYGLAPKSRMPDLDENDSCVTCGVNYLSDGRSDWVEIETIISTSNDQIAIAPGSLIKEWEENNRNYYHYKIDQPSFEFCSFISARYEVARKKWNGIDLEVYYDAKHDYNIDKMLSAMERSLDYYIKNFGPYYHQQARIIEFPRYATFAQAFPGTMPYSESFGFIIDLEDKTENNVIDAVIAHELAHQWWAHQECGASMQGGTMLTESFAEYSSLMVMKKTKDDMGMKDFLKYDYNRYLGGRSRETKKELPLYKVENQSYIHYGKGSVILYALQDYIGEEKVNQALRNFLADFRYEEPPYPRSVDFIRHLEKEIPDSLQYLIDDWFKTITLYDLRLKETTYEKQGDEYLVEITLEAKKLKADTIGNENEVALNDWIDVGVFSDDDEKELRTVERVRLKSGEQTIQLMTDTIPAKAALDPKRLLIERVVKDNSKSISEK